MGKTRGVCPVFANSRRSRIRSRDRVKFTQISWTFFRHKETPKTQLRSMGLCYTGITNLDGIRRDGVHCNHAFVMLISCRHIFPMLISTVGIGIVLSQFRGLLFLFAATEAVSIATTQPAASKLRMKAILFFR